MAGSFEPGSGAAFTLLFGDAFSDVPNLPNIATPSLSQWISTLENVAPLGASPIPAVANQVIVGAILTEEDAAALAANAQAKALADALQFPVTLLTQETTALELASMAAGLLAAHAEAGERDAAAERAALAELRQQHMDMQSAYAQVEEFAYHSLAPKFTRTQEFRNHEERAEVAAGGPALLQRLPFSMHSMAALDVWLAEPSEGALVLDLKRGVGPDFQGPVELALSGLAPGWVRFAFPRVLTGAPEDAFAEITFRGEGKAVLALSHPSPVEDYHLKVGAKTRPYPLALRGFRGLPGASLPDMAMARVAPPADGKARMVMAQDLWPIRLLPRLHRRVKFLSYKDFVSADFWEDENAFMVHPSVERPVVGILRNVSVSALTKVSAIINVGNENAGSVAFSLGVAPAGKVKRLHQAMAHLVPWTVLAAGEFGVVEQRLAEPAAGKVDLLLATSMEGQENNEKAWAFFRDFTFTNGPATA
ncbi:DUF6212 domain-containing protein [Algicella marina]|uniref:Uncharacterized protein n=1 Tax=Algicella marina TaxID=2683284 RepID=A0A6P1T568_9RHOB|nr:DUF6212 domain-containing protein [Algicella marina]QHQ36626.1 hypothetical protein GO499_16320 [Algicella marina]